VLGNDDDEEATHTWGDRGGQPCCRTPVSRTTGIQVSRCSA
jgi:hypothetical protein